MEAWELAFSPALDARMGAKAKSWFIPSRDPTYAPVVQTLCASAAGFREGAEGRIPIKTNGGPCKPVAMFGVALLCIRRAWGPAGGLSIAASGQVGTFSLKSGV